MPPKPNALTPPRRTPPAGDRPLRSSVFTAERGGGPVDVRVRVAEVQARREHLLVQGHGQLEQACRARGGLQMADVGLDRAERDRARRSRAEAEDRGQALQLGGVTDPGGGAVCLDE